MSTSSNLGVKRHPVYVAVEVGDSSLEEPVESSLEVEVQLPLPGLLLGWRHRMNAEDHSVSVLKKVLKQADVIKSTRSEIQNFESTEVEANDLQVAVSQYLGVRDTAKAEDGIGLPEEILDDEAIFAKATKLYFFLI
ncbi:hypothetical protein AgCh_017840 [Apium graveolens]